MSRCFLIATIPRIRPVLVQKKQVDQANATRRQVVAGRAARAALCGIAGMTYSAPAPVPARRSDLTVIIADKLGLLDDIRLRRPQHVERRGWGPQVEGRAADRQQAEVVVMNTGPFARTGPL